MTFAKWTDHFFNCKFCADKMQPIGANGSFQIDCYSATRRIHSPEAFNAHGSNSVKHISNPSTFSTPSQRHDESKNHDQPFPRFENLVVFFVPSSRQGATRNDQVATGLEIWPKVYQSSGMDSSFREIKDHRIATRRQDRLPVRCV